ncbi:hypothetical protein T07_10723 [Trichinella nelsoni]|uniref:Uncharacterized protein n=1 Tax=Trichinella nelsoni TaxID=6336 RepID=A0A0V0RMG2_9BILA|nr:hypothetical protein T07_10723 [Trichinella nelsoni]
MSQVAGQGPLHKPLPRERRVGSQEDHNLKKFLEFAQTTHSPRPWKRGRESLRGGRSTEHPQRNPRAQNGTTVTTLRCLRLQYPSPGAAHFVKVGVRQLPAKAFSRQTSPKASTEEG